MPETAYSFLMGLVMGWAFYRIALFLIEKRTQSLEIIRKIKQKSRMWLYTGFSACGYAFVSLILPHSSERYQTMLLFSICLCIGWIDWLIRKIPNELLLALILCKVVFLTTGHHLAFLIQGLIGLAIGFFVFMLPSILKIPIGAGDIKYAAVIGFYLGVLNFIQVMLVTALALLIYLVYLLITKKGNWKTAAAMGPYLSLGSIFTVLFPIMK